LAKIQTSPAELFAELMDHGYRIHPLPQRAIVWEQQVTLDDLVGLAPGAFINLVAVPPKSAMLRSEERLHAEAR
jgi:hypothetical protein